MRNAVVVFLLVVAHVIGVEVQSGGMFTDTAPLDTTQVNVLAPMGVCQDGTLVDEFLSCPMTSL